MPDISRGQGGGMAVGVGPEQQSVAGGEVEHLASRISTHRRLRGSITAIWTFQTGPAESAAQRSLPVIEEPR